MGDAAAVDGVGEHAGNVLLPHHVRKALGTPLTGQDEIRHDVQRRSECPQRTFEPPSGGDCSAAMPHRNPLARRDAHCRQPGFPVAQGRSATAASFRT